MDLVIRCIGWVRQTVGKSRRNQVIAGVAFIFVVILATIGLANLVVWLESGGLVDFANDVEEALLPKWLR